MKEVHPSDGNVASRRHVVYRSLVTLLIAGYLACKVNWQVLYGQLLRADVSWLLLACLLFGVISMLAAIRWHFLLQVQGIHLPVKAAVALTFIGQFFNSFLLGAIGGDIVKVFYMQKYAPRQKTHATLSILMDRVVGLAVLLIGSLLALPSQLQSLTHGDANIEPIVAGLAAVVMLGGVAAIVLVLGPFHRAPPGLRRLWDKLPYRHVVELAVSGLRQHGIALSSTLASLAAATLLTLVLVAACSCIARGIGMEVPYLQMMIILTIVMCIISLPISIGGHGVREGIFVLTFAAFGVIDIHGPAGSGQAAAVLFSLLFFAIPLVWSLVGGIVYLTFRHDYGPLPSAARPD